MTPLTPLAGIALQLGAGALSNILRGRGGAAGRVAAELADSAVGMVAEKLGVEPTETAIDAAFRADPVRSANVIAEVDRDLTELAKAASDATQSYHEVLKADAASKSLLARIWRPLNGIAFAVECLVLITVFCVLMLRGDTSTILSSAGAFGFIGTILTAQAAVVGVYVWKRSDEKRAGAA